MNLASSGDIFHLEASKREWNPKLKPISVHLDFERVAPQSNLQVSEVGRLQLREKAMGGKTRKP